MKDKKTSAVAVTIVITVIICLAIAVYAIVFFLIPSWIVRIIALLILVSAAGVMIYVCAVRIKEIKGENEDDLSKY